MMDRQQEEWAEKDAALLEQLEQLAGRLDGQRYPGRAWSVERARHGGHAYRIAWRIAAQAGAIAATVLVAVMLYRTAPRQVPETTGVPDPIAHVPPVATVASPSVPDVSAGLDVGLLARTDLRPREVDLAVPAVRTAPSVGRVGGPESYSWRTPELRLAGL